MRRKSFQGEPLRLPLSPWDKRKCVWIANFVIVQCIVVYVGSATILHCIWSPYGDRMDYDKLARIMYLYDYTACGYNLRAAASLSNIRLPNDTYGLEILPIQWKQAIVTVSTKLSSKTRVYIEISLGIHVVWNLCAIAMHIIVKRSKNHQVLKITLTIFFYYLVTVIMFDISMAVVYIADIQQSLTKGMVLRYSGWGVELKLKSYEDFAGWLPMIACIFWLRGILILVWNIYCCKILNDIRRTFIKKEVRIRLMKEGYTPIPEPKNQQPQDSSILYYRTGEYKPYVINEMLSKVFYN